MIAYLDSSVLLRVVLGQKNRLEEWEAIETGVASALVEVECLRTLDAIHLATAALWREARGDELVMATHDQALALAARASGLRVVGV